MAFLGWVLVAIALLAMLGGEEVLKWLALAGLAVLTLVGLGALVLWLWLRRKPEPDGGLKGKPLPQHVSERDMEQLLAAYPQHLLGEPLKLVGRQVTIGDGIIDLLFAAGRGQILGVEVKCRPVKRKDVGQVMDYLIPLEKHCGGSSIRLMLVAPIIAPDRRKALKRAGIECREIPEERFPQLGRERGHFRSSKG